MPSSRWNGPHTPLPVEATWSDFVRSVGGEVVEDLVPEPRTFANADFLFREQGVVAELKEIGQSSLRAQHLNEDSKH